ncbi:hypothetical protein H312_00878 [Anncaliia algerae PRA339]|uniref:Plus3 domain-containing protein n=1 Tax=Anncaliia algerae PRA339 TaxID=1288291 RepID=A0A059F3C2_9MICR|nr:hypothetical protein H312_00878 [Anncaliia algerae PRA339]
MLLLIILKIFSSENITNPNPNKPSEQLEIHQQNDQKIENTPEKNPETSSDATTSKTSESSIPSISASISSTSSSSTISKTSESLISSISTSVSPTSSSSTVTASVGMPTIPSEEKDKSLEEKKDAMPPIEKMVDKKCVKMDLNMPIKLEIKISPKDMKNIKSIESMLNKENESKQDANQTQGKDLKQEDIKKILSPESEQSKASDNTGNKNEGDKPLTDKVLKELKPEDKNNIKQNESKENKNNNSSQEENKNITSKEQIQNNPENKESISKNIAQENVKDSTHKETNQNNPESKEPSKDINTAQENVKDSTHKETSQNNPESKSTSEDPDFAKIEPGIKIFCALIKNIDLIKEKIKAYFEINSVLIYKNDKNEYVDYWSRLKFTKKDNKFVDETGYFIGIEKQNLTEIVENGKLTKIGLFQEKNISESQMEQDLKNIKSLIKKISEERKIKIEDLMNEECPLSWVDKLLFEKEYLKNNQPLQVTVCVKKDNGDEKCS